MKAPFPKVAPNAAKEPALPIVAPAQAKAPPAIKEIGITKSTTDYIAFNIDP
jgi:hypothetical protein